MVLLDLLPNTRVRASGLGIQKKPGIPVISQLTAAEDFILSNALSNEKDKLRQNSNFRVLSELVVVN